MGMYWKNCYNQQTREILAHKETEIGPTTHHVALSLSQDSNSAPIKSSGGQKRKGQRSNSSAGTH